MPIRSYKSAFIVLFLVLLAGTVASVAANAYRRASQVSLELSIDVLSEVSEKIVHEAMDVFGVAADDLVVGALAVPPDRILTAREHLFRLFWTQLKLSPRLQSLFVADADGSFVQVRRLPQSGTRLIDRSGATPREQLVYRNDRFEPIAHVAGDAHFDPRRRDWYRGAVARAGGLYWTPVYRFDTDGMPGITVARALPGAGGKPVAVLGADIALASLSELLSDQRLIEGAVPMIADGQDRLLAFPFAQRLRSGTDGGALPRVEDLDTPWLVDAYRGYRSGSTRVTDNGDRQYARTNTGGGSYITHRQPFPATLGGDWALYIVVPESSLLTPARRLLSESAVISLIILCAAGLAVWALADRLFVPLVQLEHNTRHIKAFQLDEVQRVPSSFREIQSLDEAIWSMRQGLRSLEKFVPADLARQLIAAGEEVRPGVEVRELTLFFTGIAQLADLCRALPAERIGAVLTDELDHFTGAILRLKGTIDNYLGESILAFWGAPLALDDGPERACLAALTCLRLESELYADWDEPGLAAPRNLYSVHQGRSVVGKIGSSKRLSYTALGDNVTLGWELRRLNHRYGTRIIVSGEVQQCVADLFWTRRLDRLPQAISGGPLDLYELIDERSRPLEPRRAAFIERYEAGLTALLEQRWTKARVLFEQLAAERPRDPSVALMLGRCAAEDMGYCQLMDPLAGAVPAVSPD